MRKSPTGQNPQPSNEPLEVIIARMDERLKRLDEAICGDGHPGLERRVRALERFRWMVVGGAAVVCLALAGTAGKSLLASLVP